jgi:hypothetical protein
MTENEKVSNPTGPGTATIKRLFAVSGNKCAFPKCGSLLVDGKKVVGKICHIKAKNEGGPRYDPNQTTEERHSHDNLILLCGRHHDVIDDDEDAYTVEYLHRLKERHEQGSPRMSDEHAEQGARLILFDQSISSTNQSGGMTAHTIHVHNYPPPEGKIIDEQPTGFASAEAKDGTARFRAPDQPLGLFWNMMPIAESPEHEVSLAKGPAMWLRLMPHDVTSREWSHDELLKCGRRPGVTLQPLLWSNLRYLRAEDGIGVYATIDNFKRETETSSVAFAFNTGEIWCVDTAVLQISGKKHLYFLDIARTLFKRFRGYGDFLQCLGIRPPFDWIAGLDGIMGWRLKIPPPASRVTFSSGETCLSNVVLVNGTYDLKQPVAMTLRPFFSQLFKKCSTEIPEHIEEAIRTNRSF